MLLSPPPISDSRNSLQKMVPEDDLSAGNKKRRRSATVHRIPLHQKVEVRREEEELQGSWHQGTVVGFCKQGWQAKYNVKYDSIPLDDESEFLVGSGHVSIFVDDVDDDIDESFLDEFPNGGRIRPVPLEIESNEWTLPYGLCVDVNDNETAWWEGVIFDHEDGSDERKVFFPHSGDEMVVPIDAMRVSQDWDRFSGQWNRRGMWLFLELIGEYEQERCIPVSVQQLWDDLRKKQGFKKLGGWATSSSRNVWEELLSDTIEDNLKDALNYLFQEMSLPQGITKLSEFAKLVNPNNIDSAAVVLAGEHPVPNGETASSPPKHDDSTTTLSVSNTHCHGEDPSVLPGSELTLKSTTPASSFFISDEAVSRSRPPKFTITFTSPPGKKANWVPAGSDIVPRIKFCPSAITEYAIGNGRVVHDVMGHLVYMKWKIDCMRDNGVLRMRYRSPTGHCYYSLQQLCLDFGNSDLEECPSIHLMEDGNASNSVPFLEQPTKNHDPDPVCTQPAAVDDDYSLQQLCVDFRMSDIGERPSIRSEDDNGSNLVPSLEQPTKNHDPPVCSQPAVDDSFAQVEPEYCEQAVVDWYVYSGYDPLRKRQIGRGISKVLIDRARNHLAAVGWKFIYAFYNTRRELKYISPSGKCYFSLRQSCKVCIEESGIDLPSEPIKLHSIDKMDAKRSGDKSSTKLKSDKKATQPNSRSPRVYERSVKPRSDNKVAQLDACRVGLQIPRTSEGSTKVKSHTISTQPIHPRVWKRPQTTPVPKPSHKGPRTVLAWLLENNVVLPRTKVYYYRSALGDRSVAEGRITRDGIKCSCCKKVYSLSKFQEHVGGTCISNYRGPAFNIFLKDGRSLLDCQMQIMHDAKLRSSRLERAGMLQGRKRKENDYVCSVCRYGGDLILCDLCPSSFHQSCLNLKIVPDGDWFCPYCCCRICRERGSRKSSECSNVDEQILNCTQCEHKYHISCVTNKGTGALDHHPKTNWFCSRNCEMIFSSLSLLRGKPIPVGVENLSWTLLKLVECDSARLGSPSIEVQAQCYSKLNIALQVMHECFDPLEEPQTRRDIIEDVIFSKRSELRRLDFQGFYTAILEKDDEVVCVATLRIFGEKVAEVPLIGTGVQHRRHGMCRILMNIIEKELVELGVQRLVLPAVPSMLDKWTGSFGFSKMTNEERSRYLDCTFVEFQETVMCHKQLTAGPSASGSVPGTQPAARSPVCEISDDDNDDHGMYTTPVSEVVQEVRVWKT